MSERKALRLAAFVRQRILINAENNQLCDIACPSLSMQGAGCRCKHYGTLQGADFEPNRSSRCIDDFGCGERDEAVELTMLLHGICAEFGVILRTRPGDGRVVEFSRDGTTVLAFQSINSQVTEQPYYPSKENLT